MLLKNLTIFGMAISPIGFEYVVTGRVSSIVNCNSNVHSYDEKYSTPKN
jgi:hypothetical protein